METKNCMHFDETRRKMSNKSLIFIRTYIISFNCNGYGLNDITFRFVITRAGFYFFYTFLYFYM